MVQTWARNTRRVWRCGADLDHFLAFLLRGGVVRELADLGDEERPRVLLVEGPSVFGDTA